MYGWVGFRTFSATQEGARQRASKWPDLEIEAVTASRVLISFRAASSAARARSRISESNALGYFIVLPPILIQKVYQLFGNML
jgi:hypothetical protein